MRLLFFATCPAGFGETLIGLSLANQLKHIGVTSYFIIEPGTLPLLHPDGAQPAHPYTVVEPAMGRFVRLLIDDVARDFQPDMIILADYFTHCGGLRVRYGIDPWFVDTYQVPVVPIDIWEWEKTDFTIDLVNEHVYSVSERFRELPAQLRPVPLAHPRSDGTGRARPFRVWQEPAPGDSRRRIRAELGLTRQDRLVILATAAWQQGAGPRVRELVAPVRNGIPALLEHYLRKLPPRTHFLLIGTVPPGLRALPADQVHVFPPCGPDQFADLLQAADAVLSMNIAASTVWRSVMSGIPAMVLGNRYRIPDAAALESVSTQIGGISARARDLARDCLPFHAFRMWPLGFRTFLEPLLTMNPYTDAISQAEILDESAVVNGLTALLYDPATRERARTAQAAYSAEVHALPDTSDVFLETVSQLDLVVRSS